MDLRARALAFTTIGFAVIAGGLIVGSISDRIGAASR